MADGFVRVQTSLWTLAGKGAGQRESHEILLTLSEIKDEGTPLPTSLHPFSKAASQLWKHLHYTPIRVPGYSFGMGTVVSSPADGVVESRFGLVLDHQRP